MDLKICKSLEIIKELRRVVPPDIIKKYKKIIYQGKYNKLPKNELRRLRDAIYVKRSLILIKLLNATV